MSKLICFLFTIMFSVNSLASFFEQKPDEVQTFQQIFASILSSKKSELPRNYSGRSEVVKEHGRDTVFSVQNEKCSLDNIFQAKVINVSVEGKKQDWVVFACDDLHDAVSFIRYGDNLSELDSKSIIDLSLKSSEFNIEEQKHFVLEVDSAKLKLTFDTPNYYQKVMTLEKEAFGLKFYIKFIRSEYQDHEVRWEYDFNFESHGGNKKANFLTISQPVSEDGEVYTHYRYFNGVSIEPIEYLKHFESLKNIFSQMGKPEHELNNAFPTFPLIDQ